VPTGGEVVVAALRALDVEVAFGLPGVHNLALWKAFPGSGVRLVGVRHEQTAAYAADGWARATGRLGRRPDHHRPGRGQRGRGDGGGVVVPLAAAGRLDRHPDDRAPAGVLPRGAARDDRPGVVLPPGDQGRRARGAADDLYADVLHAGRLALRAPRRPVYLEIPTDLLSAQVEAPETARDVPAALVRPLVDDLVRPRQRRAAAGLGGGGATAAGAGAVLATVAERLGRPVLRRTAGAGCCRPTTPASCRCRRTARRRARCGTPPTSCWWSAATSTP
jgi:acetolactate synthase-1/2/3 large subunit